MPKKQVKEVEKKTYVKGGGSGGLVYGLAFIGAMVYFLQQASTFWEGVVGILKAIVWPAFVVYEILKFFKI